jgi:predicted nucleic acid-binding protein
MEGARPAAAAVRQAIRKGAAMSWINLGEVAYVIQRSRGVARAEEVVTLLRTSVLALGASPTRVLAAARVKADHPMAFADAFAVSAARELDVPLLTGDPEILDAAIVGLRCRDLR